MYSGGNGSGQIYHNAILAGSSVDAPDKQNSGQYSKAIFKKDLNIEMTNDHGRSITTPIGTFGIRAIQGANTKQSKNQGSAGYVEVYGKLNLNINAKRAIGIYVSGNGGLSATADENPITDKSTGLNGSLTPKVVLKGDSNITLTDGTEQASSKWDSHAIKIGKARDVGDGPGIVESLGKMKIDTTKVENGGGIKMLHKARLDAAMVAKPILKPMAMLCRLVDQMI